MIGKKCVWIRGRGYTMYVIAGSEEGYLWQFQLHINTKTGMITNKLDRPSLLIQDPKKRRVRGTDRQWFVRNCGRDFMKDKEVDHDWNSEIVWCRVVSPMKNGNRHEAPTTGRSFVEIETWLQELYPGKRK